MSSASAVLLQVDFRQPLFLLPSGVQLRSSLEMLVDSLRTEHMTDPCPSSPCKNKTNALLLCEFEELIV